MWVFVAGLFALVMSMPIGRAVSDRVPDEVEQGEAYIRVCIDALLLVMVAILLWPLHPVVAIAMPLVLALMIARLKWHVAVLGGIFLGALPFVPASQASVVALAVPMNFLYGAISRSPTRAALVQAGCAVASALILRAAMHWA